MKKYRFKRPSWIKDQQFIVHSGHCSKSAGSEEFESRKSRLHPGWVTIKSLDLFLICSYGAKIQGVGLELTGTILFVLRYLKFFPLFIMVFPGMVSRVLYPGKFPKRIVHCPNFSVKQSVSQNDQTKSVAATRRNVSIFVRAKVNDLA